MRDNFVETLLATKFGTFEIRVYADVQGKETVVLRTESLDPKSAPLVRIHSECMTGDTFGSLHCDCGEQLERSLKQIDKHGNGILIYLRQEGRGIGLFEKIKSYKLQREGHDTFDANVLLGHEPDTRTYEKAKMVLNDLGVSRIRLITNNPSKVRDMEALGIEVSERVPIVVHSNKHNKRYLDAKRDKFNHFLDHEVLD